MAGKSKKQERKQEGEGSASPSNPSTPTVVVMDTPLKGHYGVKSSTFATTNSKLINQYMVLDHMAAHYKKIQNSKASVDTSTPRSWLVSQKVRDRVRRDAVEKELKRRDEWVKSGRQCRSSRQSSDLARDEMLEMMQGLTAADGLDDVDFGMLKRKGYCNDTMEVNVSDASGNIGAQDMHFVNRIVDDDSKSPSQYHSRKTIISNIPKETTKKPAARNTHDLLETKKHKYTEEKPFTPRTLKTNKASKLQEFKYYNAPKRRPIPQSSGLPTTSGRNRPETPMTTDSVDLMNETLMSRDLSHQRSPSGVPPLDISLDADHMNWLKEQSKRGQFRSSIRAQSEAGSEMSGYRPPSDIRRELADTDPAHKSTERGNYTLSGGMDSPFPKSNTMVKITKKEEELKYLEFITDVTNDILDRGIYTNRVVKNVFESHIEKRKHELKISKMREMLNELRRDLGISDEDDDHGSHVGLGASWRQDDLVSVTQSIAIDNDNVNPRIRRKTNQNDLMALQKSGLPTLRPVKRGGEGRPPLPRPVSRGTWSRPGSSCSRSDLHNVKEENLEEISALNKSNNMNGHDVDILEISHDEMTREFDSHLVENGHYSGDEDAIHAQKDDDDLSMGENGHDGFLSATLASSLRSAASYEREDDSSLVVTPRPASDKDEAYSLVVTPRAASDRTEASGVAARSHAGSERDEEGFDITPRADRDEDSSAVTPQPVSDKDDSLIKSPRDAAEKPEEDDMDITPRAVSGRGSGDASRATTPRPASQTEEQRYFTDEEQTRYNELTEHDGEKESEDEVDVEPVSYASSIPPTPTPRKRSVCQTNDVKDTPRSGERTITSESIDISDLDENDMNF